MTSILAGYVPVRISALLFIVVIDICNFCFQLLLSI